MSDEAPLKNAAYVAVDLVGRTAGLRGMGGLARTLLSDPKGWDPVVPPDLHLAKLPPVAADGTAECWSCKSRLPFAGLDIAGDVYACRPCVLRAARVAAEAQTASIDVDHVKIGRGRGWIVPVFAAVAIAVAALIVIAS